MPTACVLLLSGAVAWISTKVLTQMLASSLCVKWVVKNLIKGFKVVRMYSWKGLRELLLLFFTGNQEASSTMLSLYDALL